MRISDWSSDVCSSDLTGRRSAHFHHVLDHIDEHPRGSPEWMAVQFLKTTKGDPLAMKPLLDSFTDSTEEEIRRVAVPSLVVCGEDDRSEERRVGKECVSTGSFRWVPVP